jgi:hypothetical protein
MLNRRRWFLALAVAALLLVPAMGGRLKPNHTAHADGLAAGMQFDPLVGSADTSRLVSFWGFADGEILDVTYTAPDGSQATVAGGSVWYSSAQDDGTGVFAFYPSRWLSPLASGVWRVQVVGETSGTKIFTDFTITSGTN